MRVSSLVRLILKCFPVNKTAIIIQRYETKLYKTLYKLSTLGLDILSGLSSFCEELGKQILS